MLSNKIFEDIKQIDENGNEYWLARDLMKVLDYSKWERFTNAIENAKKACINSKNNVDDHFPGVGKMVSIGSNTQRMVMDYKLSRYACYLIVQNADPRKKVIALAQTYFAIQTRKQEISEIEYGVLPEDDKRLYLRKISKMSNYILNQTAKNAGVKNFDKFHNSGYRGLYNGESADDIAKRKKLRYREDILDNMGSEELGANIFRITQTEAKIRDENIIGEGKANLTHFNVGKNIRDTIKNNNRPMPEELPVPDKSLKIIEKERNNDSLLK